MQKMIPNVSDKCNKCKHQIGTLAHQLWTCPKLHPFWVSIFDFYSKAFQINCEPCPLVEILGSAGTPSCYSKNIVQAITLGTMLAKRLILRHWKEETAPTCEMWLRDLSDTLHLERLRYMSADRLEKFNRGWRPVLTYLGGLRGDVAST